jgi:hypothetical protein
MCNKPNQSIFKNKTHSCMATKMQIPVATGKARRQFHHHHPCWERGDETECVSDNTIIRERLQERHKRRKPVTHKKANTWYQMCVSWLGL